MSGMKERLLLRKKVKYASHLSMHHEQFGDIHRVRTDYMHAMLSYNNNVESIFRINKGEYEEFTKLFNLYKDWLILTYLDSQRYFDENTGDKYLKPNKYNCSTFLERNGAVASEIWFYLSTLSYFLHIEEPFVSSDNKLFDKMYCGCDSLVKDVSTPI